MFNIVSMLKKHLLITLFCTLLIACSVQAPLYIGTNVWFGYEPFYLASELNFFNDKQIVLTEFTSNTEVMRAMQNGVIDLAALTLDEAISLYQHDSSIRIIAVLDYSNGADMILSRFKSMKELKGKRIAVENTAVGGYMLQRALQYSGMSIADIKVVSDDMGKLNSLFLSGKVDAIVTFEPLASKLTNSGIYKVFDSSQIPQEITDVLITRQSVLDSRHKDVCKVLKWWFDAVNYLKQNPDKAFTLMNKRLRLSSKEDFTRILKTVSFPDAQANLNALSGAKAPLKQTALAIIPHIVALKHKDLNIDKLLYPDCLSKR